MPNSKHLRKVRLRLWNEDPHCRFCGVLTILPENIPTKHQPHNMATIEHLISRLDPRRLSSNHVWDKRRYTLACKRCNNQTLNNEDIRKHMDTFRFRCGAYPVGEAVIRLAESLEAALSSGSWNLNHEMSQRQLQIQD